MRAFRDLVLTPICLVQALGVALHALRLPEADGPRHGQIGQGPSLHVLFLGDSSAAGVGVATQHEALSGRMLARLAPHAQVTWRLVAKSGATTARARQMLQGADQYDLAVLALGVNDVLRQTRASRFAREQAGLMKDLRKHHGVQHILASAVPPLGRFDIFPQPLRNHLGRRATLLDAHLREICAKTGAVHVPFDLAPGPDWLAQDGLHPGAAFYAEWGRQMAGLALDRLS